MKRSLRIFLSAILLLFLLSSLTLGFPRIYIGPYALDGVEALNLWREEKNRVPECDRIIYVKVAVDEEYKKIIATQKDYGLIWQEESLYFMKNWQVENFVEKIIERSSKSFEYQFGIKLVLVGIETWSPKTQTSFSLSRELKSQISSEDCDIVIGFTGKINDRTAIGLGEFPQGDSLGNYILILLPKALRWVGYLFNSYRLQSYILVHELGHNFGAVHTEKIYSLPEFPKIKNSCDIYKLGNFFLDVLRCLKNNFSVMNPLTEYFTTHFDARNKEIIFENKYLPAK